MTFNEYIIDLVKNKEKKRILLIDGADQRSIEAAKKHQNDGIVEAILLLEEHDAKLEKEVPTIVISDYKDRKEELIELYVSLRKGKETKEQAEKVIFQPPYFATLLLKLEEVDGVVGGLSYATADILRPAFKVIGTKEGVKTISSVMVLEKDTEWYLFTDISVVPEPTKEQLVDIAFNASEFAKQIKFEEKVSFLSFSTLGSAKHPRAEMIQGAANEFNEKFNPKFRALGEIQFDAAFDIDIRQSKYKKATFEGKPTIFVFPSLEAGNIGYKIAQRMGNFGAVGPIVTGLAKPINDLSRGSTSTDVYNTVLVTSLQA